MQIGVDWATIKNFAKTRSLSIQYVQTPDTYYLFAIDGLAELCSQISITLPASSDQIDFESNFLPNANQSPRTNVVQVLGDDTLSLAPIGTFFTAPAGQTNTFDLVLPETMVLRGGVLFSPNASMGDYISVDVIDKDNVTGQGATPQKPITVGQYILQWFVMPNVPNEIEDVSISQTLIGGLYVRITYTSVSKIISPQVITNLIAYTGVV
jgi:hypothetical protein